MALELTTERLGTGAPCAVVLPGEAAYDAARTGLNLAVEQEPAAVAFPRKANDLAALVGLARGAGLRVAVQGGAHNAGPQGDLRDALHVRTTRMDGVEVDPVARQARVEAGVLWEAVVDAAAPHGLYPLHGSSPDVGVVGYSLGGGLGWLARSHGLQTNHVTAIELVTADGALRRIDAAHDPELFWALRGGGGNFGVVTALEFELVALTEACAGWLAWDWTESERVLQRWAEWAPDAPEAVTTSARILQLPPLPELPEAIRGCQLVVIDGAVTGDPADAVEVLAPLRALRPELDTFATIPAPALVRLHGDPEEPLPYVSDTAMLAALPPTAVSAFVAASGPESGSTLAMAELRQLGGAVGRPAPGHGAVPCFDGPFLAFALGVAPDAEGAALAREQARDVMAALAPWAGRRPYLNFVEEEIDASAGYDAESYARLRRIRAAIDPTGLFRANHEVVAA